jgi:hypothetical protein
MARTFARLVPDDTETEIDYESGEVVDRTPLKRKRVEDKSFLISWAEERRGRKFANRKAQFQAIAKLKTAEIPPDDIKNTWYELEDSRYFREKGFDFWDVLRAIDKKHG